MTIIMTVLERTVFFLLCENSFSRSGHPGRSE
jgi:hypothetical protein